jgi:uncharacterized protein YhaN
MKIKNIDLDDFGCFTRARLQNIDEGLTVIAGPQRAGKTTFMEAVRHLGYGIPRRNGLPPPTEQYDLTADVVIDENEYQLTIRGHGDPVLTADNRTSDRSLQDIYGNLGPTQYQQLFTISLDELRRMPTSLDDDVSLSAILLGAAYGDVLEIPQIRDAFSDAAKAIGGKHGRAVYDLKEPITAIQSGIEARDAAVAQVDEHDQKQTSRDAVDNRIEEIDRKIEDLTTEQTRLNTVLTEHEEFETLQELDQKLDSVAFDQIESFPTEHADRARHLRSQLDDAQHELTTAEEAFARQATVKEPKAYRERLLNAQSTIRTYTREVAGWRERVTTLREQRAELATERRDIRSRAADLRPEWNEAALLDHVRAIETDVFSRDEVRSITTTYEDVQSEYTDVKRNLSETTARHEQLTDEIETATDSSSERAQTLRDQLPVVAGGAVLALIVGNTVAVIGGAIAGVIVTLVIMLAVGAYAVSRVDLTSPAIDGVSVETLRADARSVAADIDGLRTRKATLETDRSTAREQLDTLCDDLGLPAETSPAAVREFYADLSSLQSDLVSLDGDAEVLDEKETTLRAELSATAGTLRGIGVPEIDDDDFDILADAERLFTAIERTDADLDRAEAVSTAEKDVDTSDADLRGLLSEWDDAPDISDGDTTAVLHAVDQFLERSERVTELVDAQERRETIRTRFHRHLTASSITSAFDSYREPAADDDDWPRAAFAHVVEQYADQAAIETRVDTISATIEELNDERAECVEERIELTNELTELASDDDVREAHAAIETGRRRLEPLAEEYATLRIAEYLLDELHERFVNRTTGPLLDDASEIFARITDDTYTAVTSMNEFEDLDFESVLADGQPQRTSELSRATAEQLFLAIRLARIRRHECTLPVLLDDSLTNFDPSHHIRTLQTISELTETNQVFLLTCHPELLDRIETHINAPQYWCLDDGTFDGPYSSPDEPYTLLEPSRS